MKREGKIMRPKEGFDYGLIGNNMTTFFWAWISPFGGSGTVEKKRMPPDSFLDKIVEGMVHILGIGGTIAFFVIYIIDSLN